jgi:hypothetical protein
MLSDAAVAFLSTLSHSPHAQRHSSLLPLGGIYWDDEIPDFKALFMLPTPDRDQVLRLFSIRFKIWDGSPLPSADELFWQEAQSQVPTYPLFQRTVLSEEDQQAQERAERDTLDGFEALFGDADEVSLATSPEGLTSRSAKYQLGDRAAVPKRSWWRRWWPTA